MPQPYLSLLRARDWAWWRPVLGLLLFSFCYGIAAVVISVVVFFTGVVPDLAQVDLLQPAVLLVTNASLIVAIPIVWACWVVAHGLGIGWSSSVTGRLRWQLLRPWTVRALATVGVAALLVVVVGWLAGAPAVGPGASYLLLVLVVLLTTPLQAAAEEYVFRGYVSQTVAAWVRTPVAGPVVAALVTATVFSLAHAPPDLASFLLRFLFGLAASAVVWLTGGLEAAIVMHAVYNMTLFLAGGALGSVDQASSEPGSALLDSWLPTVVLVAGMVAFVWWVAVSRAAVPTEVLSPAVDLRAGPPPPAWTVPAWASPAWAAPAWAAAGPPGGHPPPGPSWPPVPGYPRPLPGPPPDLRWAPPGRSGG